VKIKLKLFATLRNDRFDELELDVEKGSSVDLLFDRFKLKQDDVAIIFINGRHADYSTLLNDGDDVAFFPPIGGG